MADIFGTFILSKEGDTYSGEFFNNKMKAFSKEEIRVLQTESHDEFVGSFDASWVEGTGTVTAVLEIDKESDDIYVLAWKDVRMNGNLQNLNFTGRGVKRNGLLVTVYSMHTSGL